MTSSFHYYTGPGRVSIARWAPKNHPAGYRVYRKLAPTRDMMDLPEQEYRSRFFKEILGPLDPQETYDQLHELTDGVEPVLLCWERLLPGEWCHRRMVAVWFEESLGFIIPEWQPPITGVLFK